MIVLLIADKVDFRQIYISYHVIMPYKEWNPCRQHVIWCDSDWENFHTYIGQHYRKTPLHEWA